MTEIKIESLSQFISEVEKLGESYYRGEAKDFGETKNQASGYRWLYESNANFSELIALREKYYQEIGYSLSLRETENFISYAQHHGLPTELLDISENPLVSLFFACIDESKKDGFVYSLEKSKTIDLDKELIDNNVSVQFFDFDKKVMKPILRNDDIDASFIVKLCNEKQLLKYIEKYYPKPLDYNSYMTCLKKYNGWMNEELIDVSAASDIVKSNIESGLKISEAMVKYFKDKKMSIDDLFQETSEWGSCLPYMKNGDLSKRQFFKFTIFEFAFYILEDKGINDFLPMNFIVHEPSVKFDRMVNQQGKFIYQNYLYDKEDNLLIQHYIADCIFMIPSNKKKDLLLQLDRIGINRKFIYPDHDNIAKYIKDKRNS